MIRNRFTKAPRVRNPSNLHVIPTATEINSKPKQNSQQKNFQQKQLQQTNPQQELLNSIPLVVSPMSLHPPSKKKTKNFFSNLNKDRRHSFLRRSNRQKKRDAQRFATRTVLHDNEVDYSNWCNSDYVNERSNMNSSVDPLPSKNPYPTDNVKPPPPKETKKVEVVPEAPVEEENFEEVEVASSEGEGKHISVGFRKTKVQYLSYKKKCFFKPRIYRLATQRTIINCLNIDDNVSVDIDVISEAEYDEYETDNLERSDSLDKLDKIIEIEEDSAHDITDDVEQETSIINVKDEAYQSSLRLYKRSTEKNDNLVQGKSLIQNSLDSWSSHLIGLEYLIEIKNKDSVLKYHCVLCDEDLKTKESPDVYVINHINGHKHVLKYLEKHFPSCGYKFAENSDYNFVMLQKFSEKINETLGCYLMCITNVEYFTANYQKIKEIIENAYHPNEKDFKFDKSTFEKTVNCDLMDNVNEIIKYITEEVLAVLSPGIELKKDVSKKSESEAQILKTKGSVKKTISKKIPLKGVSVLKTESVAPKTKIVKNDSVAPKTSVGKNELLAPKTSVGKNELLAPKTSVVKDESKTAKHRGNTAVSSYLRLNFAAANKLSTKKSSNYNKEGINNVKSKDEQLGDKNKLMGDLGKSAKPECEQFGENVKLKDEQHEKNIKSREEQFEDSTVSQTVQLVDLAESADEDVEPDVEDAESFIDNSEAVDDNEAVCDVAECEAGEKVNKNKGKVIPKPTLHSKHCRKINPVIYVISFIKVS